MWFFSSFFTGLLFFYLSRYFPFAVLIAFLASSIYFIRKKRLLVIIVILVSFCYSLQRDHGVIEPFTCKDACVQGNVVDLPDRTDFGYISTLKVNAISGCNADIAGQEITMFAPELLAAGSEGIFVVDIKGSQRFRNPHTIGRDLSIRASLKDIYSLSRQRNSVSLLHDARARLVVFFQDNFSPDVSGFLAAIVTGDRRGVSDGTRRAFAAAGLSHLLAISGAHFGVFSFLIFSAFRSLLKRMPYSLLSRITLYIMPSELAALLSIPFMMLYLFLSGAGIPAVRSFIMVTIFLFGLLLGRKGMWKNSVAFAAFIILLVSPEAVFDISFLLSFVAVVSIGFALEEYRIRDDNRLIIEDRETWPARIKRWISITFIVTVSAYIGTIPLVLYYFHALSLVSPVTNVIVAPLVCFVIIPTAVLSSLVFLATGLFPSAVVLQFISQVVLDLISGINALSFVRLPLPAFPLSLVALFYAGLVLLIISRKRMYGALLALASLVLIFGYTRLPDDGLLKVTFLDVGQAESSVIELPDKRIMMIDTGKIGRQAVGYLDYIGASTIDILVLSHAGIDHAGGLGYVMEMKDVDLLVDNGRIEYPAHLLAGVEHRQLKRGDILEGHGYRIEVLHPYEEFYALHGPETSGDNDVSLVLRIRAFGKDILFTGDIEKEAEDDIIMTGEHVRSDIIKVAHHGSRTSSSETFIALARPAIAVISSGMFNPFGHPHEETVRTLDSSVLLNTAWDGAIKISLMDPGRDHDQERGIVIKTFQGFRLKPAQSLAEEISNYQKLFSVW